MIVDIIMPKMGESIMEGTILEWRKNIGDFIEKNELFLEIGTDKVDSEIPSPVAGNLVEILASKNDVVDVGTVIARIETDPTKKGVINSKKKDSVSLDSIKVQKPKKRIQTTKPKNSYSIEKKFFTPVVLKIASNNNIALSELETISGSGRGGRVTKKDVLAYIDNRISSPTNNQDINSSTTIKSKIKELSLSDSSQTISARTEEMHHMRKMIAENMRSSLDTSAHVYVMTEVDMTSIVDYVKIRNDKFFTSEGFKLTYTPFIVDAAVKSLQKYPQMNASITGTTISYHKEVNIGLAVALKNGLMVPTILNCDEKNFLGICRAVNDVAIRARSKQIMPDELSNSTFTITNFGLYGVTIGTPIINQPNVGILGVGAIKKQPVVIETEYGDAIFTRSIMMISLGFDHRLIDGAQGAKFIQSIRKNLEKIDFNQSL